MKKIVLKVLALSVSALFCFGTANAQEDDKTVYFVYDQGKTEAATGESPERQVADVIEAELGYWVEMFPVTQIENATPEQLEELEAADLIIIGRAIGSWNWTAEGRVIWNSIETPVLNTNPWSCRNSYLAWFDTGNVDFGGEDGVDVMATVENPDDPLFEGITLDENDQLAIWTGRYNALQAPMFAGNEEVLLSRYDEEGNMSHYLLARFEAGEDFYDMGEPNAPAGPRTFFGMGDDGATDENENQLFNYFGYTPDGETIFLREVERLANYEATNIQKAEVGLSSYLYPNPVSDVLNVEMNNLKKVEILDSTGKLIYSETANGKKKTVNLDGVKAGIYFVRLIDNNDNSVVEKIIKK